MPEDFDIHINEAGDVCLSGRFDASQVKRASAAFGGVKASCNVDFQHVEYISSAGLGVLLEAQQRLSSSNHRLKLIHLNPHIRLVFEYAGFNHVFEIE